MTDYLDKTDNFMKSLGVEAYRVGGSVRDEILGRKAKDADYMVRGLDLDELRRALLGGGDPRKARIVKLMSDRKNRPLGYRVAGAGVGAIEITLPRKEISTGPGHRDFDIVLDPALSLVEDAKRRDFTFNALYKQVGPEEGSITDPTARGLYDLQHRLVSTTHEDSFRDDPLRILRALRFVSVLGYDMTTETARQMTEHASAVNGLVRPAREQTHTVEEFDGTITSRKRVPGDGGRAASMSGTVFDEMSKLLMGDDVAKALTIMANTGVLGTLFPELAPMIGFDQASRYHDMTTDEHTFKALATAAHVDAPLRVRWALLFHDSGKPATAWMDERGRKHYYAHALKGSGLDHEVVGAKLWMDATQRVSGMPRELRYDVEKLIRNHMVTVEPRAAGVKVRRMRVEFGDDMLRDLFLHRMCDLSGKGVKVAQNHIAAVAKQERLRQEAAEAGVPASAKDLAITGRDVRALGAEGHIIGEVLARVLDEVICDPGNQQRSRDWQLTRAASLAQAKGAA